MEKNAVLRKYFQGFLFLLAGFFLASFAAQAETPTTGTFQAVNLNKKFQSGLASQKADNFLVIMDSSGSMSADYEGAAIAGTTGLSKFEVEKEILSRINQTIPDLSLIGGLRSFGFSSCLSWERTALSYDMGKYNKTDFSGGLNSQTCSNGGTSLGLALDEAVDDLQFTQGEIAVIVASDGHTSADLTLPYARNLKDQYGDRLCIYPIWMSGRENGKLLMDRLADIGECGFAVKAADIASAHDMARYVQRIFLGENIDSDGDGVPDARDECPDTPAGVKVDDVGCPLDSDGDGVPDYLDKCPGTPRGTPVNKYGCWVGGRVLFDFDKADIKPKAFSILNELAAALKKIPEARIEISGHTDSVGSPVYNMGLSERRANAVRGYLVQQGVAPDQLIAKGYGLDHPIYPNNTQENRAKNRRVQLKVIPYK